MTLMASHSRPFAIDSRLMTPNRLLPLAAAALCTSALLAQGAPAPQFRMFGRIFRDQVDLYDRQDNLLHTWTGRPGGLAYHMLPDGDILRTYRPQAAPTGYPAGSQGGVERLAFDGTVVWDYELFAGSQRLHHDIEPMPNGNLLVIAWDEMPQSQAIAIGRSPQQALGTFFRPDSVLEIEPTAGGGANVVWEWHVRDHVIQDLDSNAANFGTVSSNPQLIDINYPLDDTLGEDWNHFNSVKYDPVHDWIIVSAHRQDEIWVIDHSTTTAEAAGHTGGARGKGGDLLYRWGNTHAYQMGTPADQQLFGQHGPYFIPDGLPGAGNILLFNNTPPGGSYVFELVPPLDANGNFVLGANGTFGPAQPVWSYTAPEIASSNVSNARRLPNGNTLICAGAAGKIVEVDPAGTQVYLHTHPGAVFHAQVVDRRLWANDQTVSIAAGGTIQFDLVAGTEHAGDTYWLLGSFGTSPILSSNGVELPLALDPYLLFTIENANTALLSNTRGTVGSDGRAYAAFNLPSGIVPPALVGLELYHAYVLLDAASGALRTSHAEPLKLVQ
ncbi:MAG: aryl-sulfate sulfotransferase [Planctomycetota bacterium]